MNKTIFRISAVFSIYGIVNLLLYIVLHIFNVIEFKVAAYASFVLFGMAIWIPWILNIYFKVGFPKYVLFIFNLFLVATTILGNVWDAYTLVPYYDKFIHFGSGIMIPLLFVYLFKGSKTSHLSSFWLFVLSLTCAVSVGAMWEVIEYIFDGIFMTNSQNALGLMGRDALMDSMFDLICDTCGGIIGASRALLIYHLPEKQAELKSIFSS